MGLFDRFKRRVQEVAEDVDSEELTAEEGTQEAEEAIATTLSETTESEWDEITET